MHGYLQHCKAFIFPVEDDFGIAPVEAMLHGKPVVALNKGGGRESVIEGMTGEFFNDSHPVALADGVRRLLEHYSAYNPQIIRKRAERFSLERFEKEIHEYLENILAKHQLVL